MQEANSHPEIVFGLVGPIGVDMGRVQEKLEVALSAVGYKSENIRITDIMRSIKIDLQVKDVKNPQQHYESRIDFANAVCRRAKSKSVLAGLAIMEIRNRRSYINKINNNKSEVSVSFEDQPIPKTAYIIRQLKRADEINLLRKVYGRKFVQVSVNLNASLRESSLSMRISAENPNIDSQESLDIARKLIERDHLESNVEYGQRLSTIFHLGDVFVDSSSDEEIERSVNRFIYAFFGKNSISPNLMEYGSYIAASASLRSLDTSRQVGAAIFSNKGEVIALGCNEVPKYGGGTYWSDHKRPQRDYDIGQDANFVQKKKILFDLIKNMHSAKLFVDDGKSVSDLFEQIIKNDSISNSLIMDITEYGRMTHAEMNAITDAARKGAPTEGAIMYCTTFPCHNCAKHIVAAGIEKVIYIEPYPKSMAPQLHKDSISINGDGDRVGFEHFVGISPRRYRDIFEKKNRKNEDGTMSTWYEGGPSPRILDKSPFYVYDEPSAALNSVGELWMTSPLRPSDDGFTLRVRVTPKASNDAIEGVETAADGQEHLKVRVRAVPDRGRANAAVAALVADRLGVPKSAVTVVAGHTARIKTLRIDAGPEARDAAEGLLKP